MNQVINQSTIPAFFVILNKEKEIYVKDYHLYTNKVMEAKRFCSKLDAQAFINQTNLSTSIEVIVAIYK